jgi:hypothetical protein
MDTFVINVRSLSNMTDPTADFVIANNLKMLFLTDTWQKNDMVDTAVFSQARPPDYKFFSIPRHNRRVGGSLTLIYHDSIKICLSPSILKPYSSFELAVFHVTFGSKLLFVILCIDLPAIHTFYQNQLHYMLHFSNQLLHNRYSRIGFHFVPSTIPTIN